MVPIDNPINYLFDFDAFDDNAFNNNAFDDNGQDIRTIADQHLFDNGSDLFGVEPSHLAGQTMAVPHSSTRVDPSAHITPEGFDDFQVFDREFFDTNLELFPDENHDAGFVDVGPVDQPISQFTVQHSGEDFGLSLEPARPIMSQMSALSVEPETILNPAQSSPQIVLATFEEQQQWQAFKSQQTRFYQPQPQTPQFQQTTTSRQWGNVDEVPGLALQSPFESPIDELFQKFPDPEAPANLQKTAESLQGNFLSYEQIHLLQNAEPRAYVQPSVELSPTNAAFPHGVPNADSSPPSRSARGRRSLSPRTPTPEQTPQAELAGLSFASLEDAEAAMPSRYIENDWEAPSDDPSIPTTQKKRAEYVLGMFEAFQDCSECKDNKNGNSYVKRWLGGPGSYYNLLAMEKVCWHMLDIAERLHNDGPESTNMYCEEALKKLKASRDMTFQQRIYHVCAMLKYSKFACDQLMKGEGLETLVGAPKLKMSGATTMQVQNQKRQKWIVHGRTEDLHHSKSDRNEINHQDEHEDVQISRRKTKTKQKTKRPAPKKRGAKPKTRPTNTSRDGHDDDEVVAHRRQSDPGISQTGYTSDIEMDDEPQQIVAAVLQIPTPNPQPPSKPQRNHPEFRGTVSVPTVGPVASSVAVPASQKSPAASSFPSSIASTPSPGSSKSPNIKQPKHAGSSQAHVSRAEVNAGRTRFRETSVDKQKVEKMRKKREAKLAAYRAAAKASAIFAEAKATARETQLAPSTLTKKTSANKAAATPTTATKTKTKTGTRKRAIDLTETDSEDDQPAQKAKRQRTTQELLAEWMIRNDGSNEDDVRDAGYAPGSGRLSDAEKSDSDEESDDPVWADQNPTENDDSDKEQDEHPDDEEDDGDLDIAEEDPSEQSDDSRSEQTPEEESEHSEDDSSEHSEEVQSDSERDESETSSLTPSPIRKRKIEKVAAKGAQINQVHPLVKTSRYATKAAREAAKRKQQRTTTPGSSESEVNTPPAKPRKRKSDRSEAPPVSSDPEIKEMEALTKKRTKRNDGSTRKFSTPGPAKQTRDPTTKKSGPPRDVNGKFLRRKAPPEPSPESNSALDSESESEPESEPKPEPKKSGSQRDAKGKFIRRKRN